MVTEQDIIDLKEAFTLWQSLEIIFEYGPLRAYTEHYTVQELWRKTIDPAVALVHETSRKVQNIYVVEAPNPWHAFFYLRAQQQYLYRNGRPLGSTINNADSRGGEHLFFRGQLCTSWETISSIRRKDPITQGVEKRAVTALVEYFRTHFISDDDVAVNTALCFAQHYGIATELMDISCDPDVAVWFATHPLEKACPDGENEGMVQAVTWASQAEGSETVFLLPPPFIRNVYKQRGLFIDTSSTNGRLKGTLSLNIQFPRETAGGEFCVLRRGHLLDVWPPLDAVEYELVSWAQKIGEACADEDAVLQKVQLQRSANGLPKFWLEREFHNLDKIVNDWLSILDWVLPATCVTALPVKGPAPMRYEILDLKLRSLVRANPTFFKAFTEAAQGANFAGFEVLEKVLNLARDELNL